MVNHCCSAEGRGISDVRFRGASRPMTRGYLDRPGCRVYYEVAGSGPLLVFAHGLGGNHLSWWQQVPYFRDRYTCVTFAHRGFAPSERPPRRSRSRRLCGRRCGADRSPRRRRRAHRGAIDGRLVCSRLRARSPARVRALVLASTAGAITRAASQFGVGATDACLGAQGRRRRVRHAGEQHPRGRRRAHGARAAGRASLSEIDALSGIDKVKLRQRLANGPTRPADVLRTLDVPTLWLTGAEDVVYPPFLSASWPA